MSEIVRRLCAAVIATSAIAAFTVGCSSDIEPKAIAESSSVVTETTIPTTSKINGQEGVDDGGDVDIDVAIGDCVELSGTAHDANIENAVCGSMESNYKVVSKAPTSDDCATDVDSAYYETFAGDEQGAVCLDIDWVVGGCIDMGTDSNDDQPVRIDCSSSGGTNPVRVVEILQNSSSYTDCSGEADSGLEYPERNFTVCIAEL